MPRLPNDIIFHKSYSDYDMHIYKQGDKYITIIFNYERFQGYYSTSDGVAISSNIKISNNMFDVIWQFSEYADINPYNLECVKKLVRDLVTKNISGAKLLDLIDA